MASREWTKEDTRLRNEVEARNWELALRTADSRPYIQLMAVGDGRDHQECARLDNIVVRIDNPWLLTHRPPHRKKCRCTFRTLNDRQMVTEGLVLTPDDDLPG